MKTIIQLSQDIGMGIILAIVFIVFYFLGKIVSDEIFNKKK